jgi:2-methylcitrate dehydratase
VLPDQYRPERIVSEDVQNLLKRVEIRPDDELSERFPDEHLARIKVTLRDGRELDREQHDYEGFTSRPMSWDTVVAKFDDLAPDRDRIKEAVANLEKLQTRELTRLLEDT